MLSTTAIETLAVSSALLVALIYPWLGSKWFSRAEQVLALTARRRRMGFLLCGFLALALRAAVLPIPARQRNR